MKVDYLNSLENKANCFIYSSRFKRKKYFEYYITDYGVLSFTQKFVFINGVKTKSILRLHKLLQSFDSDLFSNTNLCIFHVYSYQDYKDTLFRLIKFNTKYHITTVSSCFVHKAADIFHGQYDTIDGKFSHSVPF